MELIAISVLFLFYVLSFTLTFTRACISIKPCCCGAERSSIYTVEWCKGPHSHDMMPIIPQKSHFGYSQLSVSLFLTPFDVRNA